MRFDLLKTLGNTLPETPGILGRQEYLNSAVLVPIIYLGQEYQLVFEKRAAGISQENEVCFPGGRFDGEVDKSYGDTALRETVEELGVTESDVRFLGRLDTLVTPRGLIVEPFVGELHVTSLGALSPDPREVDEVFTVPIRWFIENSPEIYENRIEIQSSYRDTAGNEKILLPVEELGLPEAYSGSREGWRFKVYVYRTKSHIIWGLTAKILHHFISVLPAELLQKLKCSRGEV